MFTDAGLFRLRYRWVFQPASRGRSAARRLVKMLGVQLQRDPVKQPVENLTVVWDEAETPFLPLGRLEIPKQKVDAPRVIGGKCETASFNPWRTIAEHRPLGALNRARLIVYEASALARKK